jgi:hypothetical protein
MDHVIDQVFHHRTLHKDAYYFNWQLHIEQSLQLPFEPTHTNMAALNLTRNQPAHELAANLRRAFSGIVAGNVKEQGQEAIRQNGPFELRGDAGIMAALDDLLQTFVRENRMKLGGKQYTPCYRLVQPRH